MKPSPRLLAPLLVAILLLLGPSPARAGIDAATFDYVQTQAARALPAVGVVLFSDAPAAALARAQADRTAGPPALTSGDGGTIRQLALPYAPAHRRQAEQLFTGYLTAFARVEQALGLPAGDLAGAATLVVLAAIEVERDRPVDQAAYQPVVAQLRRVLAASPRLAAASAVGRRQAYEVMVIAGMILLEAKAAAGADAALASRTRAAAVGVLRHLLRAAPVVIQVGPRGLSVGAGATSPAAASDAGPTLTPAPAPTASVGPVGPRRGSPAVAGALFSWRSEYGYTGMNHDLTLHIYKDLYLLFADGTCLSEPPANLDGFDAAASRAAAPKDWCRWRRRGGAIQVTSDGKYISPSNPEKLDLVRAREHLAGTWIARSFSEGASTSSYRRETLMLAKSGRFALSKDGVVDYDWKDASGERAGTRIGASKKGDGAGQYLADGHALELRFDDGRVERHLLLASPDRDFLMVGNKTFSRARR
jgi:hypothetical protein